MSSVEDADSHMDATDTCGLRRCLSIQSHVVSGYVGNKCAVFPMQLHGFDVCPVNSVQFSNHTGYKSFRGQAIDGDQLLALMEGLKDNGLFLFSHVLTGYMRTATLMRAVVQTVKAARERNPQLTYVCDPVMGDAGKLYIPPELVSIYRDEIVPLATMLTPNQFEIEQLTGISIANERDAIRACDALHDMGVGVVVITSVEFAGDDAIVVIASARRTAAPPDVAGDVAAATPPVTHQRLRLHAPRLPRVFTGTGDLMAALLLLWTHRFPGDLPRACEHAFAALQAVCTRTFTEGATELQLVACRRDLEAPRIALRAEPIEAAGEAAGEEAVTAAVTSAVTAVGTAAGAAADGTG